MQHRIRGTAVMLTALVFAVCALALSACGGSDSSGQARTLLKQTFSGAHKIDSGNLNFNLTLDPSGSSTLTTPLSLSFDGPFQSLGAGKLPQSDFTITLAGLGRSGSVSLVSTGQNGYVTLKGTSYELPAATFQTLEKSFSGLASTGAGGSGSTLSKLGIDPLRWLANPSVVGDETVGGAQTTHIKAGINVTALLADLNTFLAKASSIGVPNASKIPTSISPATAQKIANAVKTPRFDVWTGKSDNTPRKISIQLSIPVSGQISTLLGGLRTADIALTLQYAGLNQPQTISAPSTVRPFSEFTAKLGTFERQLQSVLGGALGGVAGSAGSGSSATPSATIPPATTPPGATAPGTTSTPANVTAYSQCVQAAGSDVQKLQRCAALLQN
jgi:hypothetical protein